MDTFWMFMVVLLTDNQESWIYQLFLTTHVLGRTVFYGFLGNRSSRELNCITELLWFIDAAWLAQ